MSSCKIPQPMLPDSAHFQPQSVRARPFRPAPTLASLASLNTRHPESRTTMAWLFPFDGDLLVSANGLFQVNYTYGHALDEVSNGGPAQFTAGSSEFPQDPFNLRGSYGAADYDVRHSFNANYVWQLPVKTMLHGRGPDYLVKGWQVSGTIFARTGFPYTVIDLAESGNLARNNFDGTIYSVPVAPLSGSALLRSGSRNPTASRILVGRRKW